MGPIRRVVYSKTDLIVCMKYGRKQASLIVCFEEEKCEDTSWRKVLGKVRRVLPS
jgi:hypothetical protein